MTCVVYYTMVACCACLPCTHRSYVQRAPAAAESHPHALLPPWRLQAEVEGYYTSSMSLLLPYTQAYWLGLQTNTSRVWGFTDRSLPPLDPVTGYTRWLAAANLPGSSATCAAAHWLPGRSLTPPPLTWGWQDAACARSLPSICKILREWRATPQPGVRTC